MSDDDVASFLADAVSLEDNYRTMLATLKDAGCKVVRFQHDHAAQGRLVKAFAKTGLELLGPSRKALDATVALASAGRQQDAATLVQDRLRQDAELDVVSLFRSAASVDADNRSGFLVNLQSTIATLVFDDYKVMLGGDFQFVKPQVKDDIVLAERDRLLAEIQQRAPFDLVKLSHHGSDNVVNDAFLDGLGATPLVGMSSGRGQPNIRRRRRCNCCRTARPTWKWVRTDRNGHVTVEFTPATDRGCRSAAERCRIRSPIVPPMSAPCESSEPEASVETTVSSSPAGERQITTTLPPGVDAGHDHRRSRPGRGAGCRHPRRRRQPAAPPSDSLPIGGGPRLGTALSVTAADGLAANIGASEADFAMHSIRPPATTSPSSAAQRSPAIRTEIRRAIDKSGSVDGVVILGGYDLVPAYRVDTMPDEVGKAAKTLRGGTPTSSSCGATTRTSMSTTTASRSCRSVGSPTRVRAISLGGRRCRPNRRPIGWTSAVVFATSPDRSRRTCSSSSTARRSSR